MRSFSIKRTISRSVCGSEDSASDEGPGCSGDDADDGECAASVGRSLPAGRALGP